MKKTKAFALCSMAAASILGCGSALAGLSGNIGVASNYIWRGLTQTDDGAAVSGGIDYATDPGYYLGAWVSNTATSSDSQYELDLYGGYAFKGGSLDLDVGLINYRYPTGHGPDQIYDFAELYLNASFDIFSVGVAYTFFKEGDPENRNDLYGYARLDFELKKDLYLGMLIGHYGFDDPANKDYTHTMLSLSKENFAFAFDKTSLSGTAGDTRWSVSWSMRFDL